VLNDSDDLYYRLESDDESDGPAGFREPLQSSDRTLLIKSEDDLAWRDLKFSHYAGLSSL